MTAAEICGRLKGVRRSRDGWTALCPAHTDRTPSLCIREIDGKILLRCHAGCTAEAVCDALGIRMRDLFLEKDSARANCGRVPLSCGRRRIVIRGAAV